jgi:hypothetical protein
MIVNGTTWTTHNVRLQMRLRIESHSSVRKRLSVDGGRRAIHQLCTTCMITPGCTVLLLMGCSAKGIVHEATRALLQTLWVGRKAKWQVTIDYLLEATIHMLHMLLLLLWEARSARWQIATDSLLSNSMHKLLIHDWCIAHGRCCKSWHKLPTAK